MKLRLTGYDWAVVAAAFVAWGICLVPFVAPSLLLSFLDQLRGVGAGADWRAAVMNGFVLLVISLAVAVVATHIFVCSRKALRQRFQPTLASHLAFFALLWLAFGGVWVCMARPYPFIKSVSQDTEQAGPPKP
jgi:chromate transport protein ChrA